MEAGWAAFFDALLPWTYEPERYKVKGFDRAYMPDFRLQISTASGASDCWAEVRPSAKPNEKAKAFASCHDQPMLLCNGYVSDNNPLVLLRGGASRTVQLKSDGSLKIVPDGTPLINEDADLPVARAALQSVEYGFEAATRKALHARVGVDPDSLANLSRAALLTLHVVETMRQPVDQQRLSERLAQAGLPLDEAAAAVRELQDAGNLLPADQRRTRLTQPFSQKVTLDR